MYIFLLLYSILGAGIKYIDDAFDEKVFNKKIALVAAPFLGIIWAYTMVISPVSATILLAVICGVFFKGKIDNYAHILGLGVIIAVVILTGLQLLIIPLIILAVAALLDEVGNDAIDNHKEFFLKYKYGHRFLVYFFDHRWVMKIALLSLVLINMVPFIFFVAMVAFDESYIIVRWYGQNKKKISRPWLQLKIYNFKTTISNNVKSWGEPVKELEPHKITE
jgi:hypothetical protein